MGYLHLLKLTNADLAIKTYGRQVGLVDPFYLIKCYHRAVREPGDYILFDNTGAGADITRLRGNIFPFEFPMRVSSCLRGRPRAMKLIA